MSGLLGADLFVGGVIGRSADIARFDGDHACLLLHQVFDAPEAAAGKDGFGGGCRCGGVELQGDRIDAVGGVFRGESFAGEYVAEVGAASGAGDFGALSVRVGGASHGAGQCVVEAGPAASGVEFVGRPIERCAALFAVVGAVGVEGDVFSAERGFGAFVDDDVSVNAETCFWVLCCVVCLYLLYGIIMKVEFLYL